MKYLTPVLTALIAFAVYFHPYQAVRTEFHPKAEPFVQRVPSEILTARFL